MRQDGRPDDDGMGLALLAEGMEPRQWPAEHIGQLQMVWLTSENAEPHKARPLPLAVSPQECPWRPAWAKECISRGITMRALERGGVPYRIVSSAGTTAAQLAAVQAGIAVASTAPLGPLPAGVRIVQPEEGLPELADCGFLMLKGQNPRQPMTDMLAEQIRAVFAAEPLGRATATAPSDPLAKSG